MAKMNLLNTCFSVTLLISLLSVSTTQAQLKLKPGPRSILFVKIVREGHSEDVCPMDQVAETIDGTFFNAPQNLFQIGINSINRQVEIESYGQVSLTRDSSGDGKVDLIGPYPIPDKVYSTLELIQAAKDLLKSQNTNIQLFHHVVILTPPDVIGTLSGASEICHNKMGCSTILIQACPSAQDWLWNLGRTALHELGHSFGLGHSSWDDNGDGVISGALRLIIGNEEYGDGYSVMGSGLVQTHFNAAEKYILGWFDKYPAAYHNSVGDDAVTLSNWAVQPEQAAHPLFIRVESPHIKGKLARREYFISLRKYQQADDKVLDPNSSKGYKYVPWAADRIDYDHHQLIWNRVRAFNILGLFSLANKMQIGLSPESSQFIEEFSAANNDHLVIHERRAGDSRTYFIGGVLNNESFEIPKLGLKVFFGNPVQIPGTTEMTGQVQMIFKALPPPKPVVNRSGQTLHIHLSKLPNAARYRILIKRGHRTIRSITTRALDKTVRSVNDRDIKVRYRMTQPKRGPWSGVARVH